MANFLITGASGFIGHRLATRLSDAGHTVVALMRSKAEGHWARAYPCDLIREPVPKDALAGVDVVFHLASKAHALAERPGEESGYRAVIVEGTRRVVEAMQAAGMRRLIYLSSVKAMGEGTSAEAPLDEDAPCCPSTPYGQCKREAEKLVESASGLESVILRPVMVYGPGQKGNLERMIEAVRRHRFPPLPEVGNRRSMVHVDTVIEACLAAAIKEDFNGGTYILADDEAWSTRQLYEMICEALGRRPSKGTIPLPFLKLLAKMGDGLEAVVRRRLPFDSDALEKLTGSAWYSNARMTAELTPARLTLRDFLKG